MNRIFTIALLMCLSVQVHAQKYTWNKVPMDGSRVGCRYAAPDDIGQAIGFIESGVYHAPNGAEFRKNSPVGKVAAELIAAQPAIAEKKTIVGHTDHEILRGWPESELSNMIIDLIIDFTRSSGKDVQMGVLNFGGIRADLPQGNILMDDVESMLPFKNYIVYVEHRGSEIRKILEHMAATKIQVLGGVKMVVEDKQVVSIEIGGRPLDDDKVYGVATITFLLNGGDGLYLAENALKVEELGALVNEPVMAHIKKEHAEGRSIEYHVDGRVIVR